MKKLPKKLDKIFSLQIELSKKKIYETLSDMMFLYDHILQVKPFSRLDFLCLSSSRLLIAQNLWLSQTKRNKQESSYLYPPFGKQHVDTEKD